MSIHKTIRSLDDIDIEAMTRARTLAEALWSVPEDRERLARLIFEWRPYDTLPAFAEGFRACQNHGVYRSCPYEGVEDQAWARGAQTFNTFQRGLRR